MMVANSFDLWQKDSFFTAAEEVQESADVMQSAYRMWVRVKNEGSKLEDLDELTQDLQTALGTAKWQLEEFERAVLGSHVHRGDGITASRHKQFVAAIESQIAQVEEALKEAFNEGGRKPLQWVNLNKEERDDLALFLSGTSHTSQTARNCVVAPRPSTKGPVMQDRFNSKDVDNVLNSTSSRADSNGKDDIVLDVEDRGNSVVKDDVVIHADKASGTRRTWSSPNFSALKIVIANEDDQRNTLPTIEATPKEKGSKTSFWKQRCGEHSRGTGSFFLNQVGGFQRQLQAPRRLQSGCSIQLTLALMLSIFLIVPFLVYSA